MDVMEARRRLLMRQPTNNVNVWDETWELGTLNTRTGGNVVSTSQIRSAGFIAVKPNTKYYFYAGKLSQWAVFFDSDKNIITVDDYPITELTNRSVNAYAIHNREFTTPPICQFMKFYCTMAYGTVYLDNISINYPSTDHNYHKHV